MTMKKFLLSLFIMSSSALAVNAQEHSKCNTYGIQETLIKENPQYAGAIEALEKELSQVDLSKLEKTRAGNYIIPIVFHVLHTYGSENISDDQIKDGLRVLNEYYQKKNPDTAGIIPIFKPLIGNAKFEFRLANKDPWGNCTNGIDRIESYKTKNAGNQSKLNPWNRAYYLNVWVITNIDGSPVGSGTLAFALKPAAANYIFYYDGIICTYPAIGTIGTGNSFLKGTLAHEIGHYFNLDHPWGGTNQPKVACGDDGVMDTPETKGHDNCNILYDSTCNPPIIENVQNIMDYSFCPHEMFTIGQVERMTSALLSPTAQRNSLISPAGHAYAGVDGPANNCAPKADFNVNRRFVCVGNTVTFTNRSFNYAVVPGKPLTLNWDFSADGNPATSTSTNPVAVSFTTPGWKNISLTANVYDSTGSKTRQAYIYVADPVGKNVVGQINHFEDETVFNNTWANFNYYNNPFKWQHYQWGGYYGTKCIQYRGFDDRAFPANTVGSAAEDIDELYTEAYNLSSLSAGNAYLNFFMAGATRASILEDIKDSLVIDYSTNCGTSWSTLAKISKAELANNGYFNSEFHVTNATQWAGKSIALSANVISSNTFFRIRYRPSDLSNNFYFDNFEINSTPVSVKNYTSTGFTFEIIPNPSNTFASLQLNVSDAGKANIQITNILGAKVANYEVNVNTGVLNNIEIPAHVFNTKGIYFVNIDIDGKKMTKKMIVQ